MNIPLPKDRDEALAKLVDALPEEFPFYHLGSVEMQQPGDSQAESLEGILASLDLRVAVGFSFQGDVRSVLVMFFKEGLDISKYMEVGNILASQIANRLSVSEAIDVLPSPPRVLSTHQVHELLRNRQRSLIHKTYRHIFESEIIPIEVLILPVPSEEVGYA